MTAVHPYLEAPPPRAFAHRGWHVGDLAGMENSLSAFRRAVAEGYRYVETDVHATADGTVVIHHDPTLDRTTDRAGAILRQPWNVVRHAKIDGREPVSRLEDVLEELPDVFFNIDVKSDAAVEPFVRVVRRQRAFDRVAAAAFSETRLARLRKLAGPRLLTSLGPRSAALLRADGWLPFLRLGSFSRGVLAQVPLRRGPVTVVDKAFIAAAHRLGVEVHTWTINDKERMRSLLDLGVHGIVTDRPDLLRELLIERGSWPSV
ncbi:glycerophosphodiester phosphodiesterase family protein [Saccharomonospora cyanea]|nr:glycerophosphodiester phosphodiesterase family protein [Saccharomonospora cyanea]